jgi:hypothetical protein
MESSTGEVQSGLPSPLDQTIHCGEEKKKRKAVIFGLRI